MYMKESRLCMSVCMIYIILWFRVSRWSFLKSKINNEHFITLLFFVFSKFKINNEHSIYAPIFRKSLYNIYAWLFNN